MQVQFPPFKTFTPDGKNLLYLLGPIRLASRNPRKSRICRSQCNDFHNNFHRLAKEEMKLHWRLQILQRFYANQIYPRNETNNFRIQVVSVRKQLVLHVFCSVTSYQLVTRQKTLLMLESVVVKRAVKNQKSYQAT